MSGSHIFFLSCSGFVCSTNDGQPWETSVTEGPGKAFRGQWSTSTNSQGCCDNYISSVDNLERLFPSAERLVGVFPLGPYEKKEKKDGGGGGGKVTVEIWLKGRFNLQTFQVFQEIFYDIICILIYSLHTIYVPVVP